MSIKSYIDGGSPTMKFKVELDSGQVYTVDLGKELRIFEARMTGELKEAPRVYAFLLSLYKDRLAKVRKAERALDGVESRLIRIFTSSKSSEYYKQHSKVAAVNTAKILAKDHKSYHKKAQELERWMRERDKLEVAVKSFEMRAELLRTLNANSRNKGR